MTEQVTLKLGDYVLTYGMTQDQYHAVAKEFLAAGAKHGEYPEVMFMEDDMGVDWAFGYREGELWHGLDSCFDGRHLTIDQVLAATNAGENQEPDMSDDFKLKCILHSAQRSLEEERQELEMAKFHNVKAAQCRERHDKMMQQARDMLPDGWFLVRDGWEDESTSAQAPTQDMSDPANWKIGDVLEIIDASIADKVEIGDLVTMLEEDEPPHVPYCRRPDGTTRAFIAASQLRFHHRPNT